MFELTSKEIQVYNYLKTNGYCSKQDLIDTFDLHVNTVDFYLREMKRKGVWFLEKRHKQKGGWSVKLIKVRQWSAKNNLDCCKQCQVLSVRHKGNGLCLHCWDKERDKKPQRQKVKKKAHDTWYKKVKGTEVYKEYTNRRSKIYRDTSNAYKGFLQRQYRKGRAKRKALNKQNRRSWRNGITYTCDCCGEKVKTPYTSEYLQDNFNEFVDFRKFTELIHKNKI